MDTTDIVLGLAAAAGAVYFVERGKRGDNDGARDRHEAAHARERAARAQHEAEHAEAIAAEAQRRALAERQARLVALKAEIQALDAEKDAKARALAAMAGASTPSATRPSAASTTTPSAASGPTATASTSPRSPAPGPSPVSSPDQVDPPKAKRNGEPTRFDPIFAEYGGGIPIEYLRALAIRESDLTPDLRSGPAWGLLQVIEVVRDDYNRRHGTDYARADLLDPRVNVTIAADTLRAIAASYERNHPDVANLRADWDNPRFVELLTFGWNAGFSERGGVGRVARHLEQQGITDITLDLVHENALAAGASRELARSDKVRWSKSVVALYLAARARTRAAEPAASAA